MPKAQNHGVWVYGVIVGLAIREALTKVIPQALPMLADPQKSAVLHIDAIRATWLYSVRLVVFLAMIVRFYLGSATYFETVYCSEKSAENYPNTNPGIDFLLGLIHFILFFVWSETLTEPERFADGLSGFLVILGTILAYDLIWWFVSVKYSTKETIRAWAVLNLLTLGASYGAFFIVGAHTGWGNRATECAAFFPVLAVTVADFGEMFSGTNLITDWIVKALSAVRIKS